jgi:hypothetical protein
MATALRATIIPYKTELVPSELTTVKLKQNFDDGTYREKKCPVFTGEHGIEALLYVEERFRKIASKTLLWTTGAELFDGFEEVLLDTALNNWEDLTSTIADVDKTPASFEATIQALYRKYVGAEARDIQFEHFRSLKKPLKASILDHSSRMLTLARYGNKLPGIEPALNDEQIKKFIFQSFPALWQQQYIRSGQRVAGTPLADIIEFMSNEKLFADTQNAARMSDKKKPYQASEDTSKNKRKTYGKKPYVPAKRSKEFHGIKPDTVCPIHGGHQWVKCFDNPNGDSFKPRGADGNRVSGGRGRGRGGYTPNAGRGHGRGNNNNNGRGSGQFAFQAKLPSANEVQTPAAGSPEQHLFDQIGKDPTWGWDASAQSPGE